MFARALAKRQVRKSLEIDELPSFPAVIADAMRRLRDPEAPLADVGSAIANDPGISAKLLRMANSTAFALRHPVRSVPHAVSLLGRGTVESLLLGSMVANLAPPIRTPEFDSRQFWMSSARRGLVGRAIARDVASGRESEVFTEALLHDMAVPFLLRTRGEPYQKVLVAWRAGEGQLHELEQVALGFDHAEVAGWMAERWEFPTPLVEALASHHEAPEREGGATTPGRFVASWEAAEEQEFVDAAVSAFDVRPAKAAGWIGEAENAPELASALNSP